MSDNTRRQTSQGWDDDRIREFVSLTDELRARLNGITAGGARRDRTDDLLLAKQALSQLSYGPKSAAPAFAEASAGNLRSSKAGLPTETVIPREGWWAWEDLNFRPHAYQARALTN